MAQYFPQIKADSRLRLGRCLLMAVCGVLLIGCGPEDTPEKTVQAPRLVIPGTVPKAGGTKDLSAYEDEYSEQLPKVEIAPEDLLLQVLTVNLDLDQTDEQVLVLRARGIPDAPVRVAVVDFDSILNTFFISWEHETGAMSYRSFQLTLEDLVGDHEIEIVCTGLSTDGKQTLDAFHRSRSSQESGLSYTSIFSERIEGTIEIEVTTRSQAYHSDRKNGISFPIIAYERDPESENLNDLIKTTYLWKHQAQAYIQVKRVLIPGKDIADRRLKELYRQDADAFEKFLDGPWSSSRSDGKTMIILFEPVNDLVTLFSGDVQEIYRWENSYRYLSNSISIHGVNELMPFIRIQAAVRVDTLDTLRVTIYEINSQTGVRTINEEWSGQFFRLSGTMQRSLLRSSESIIEQPDTLPNLVGYYTGETGGSIQFDHPRFTMRHDDETVVGTFSVYSIGNYILELRIQDRSGVTVDSRTYKFDLLIEEHETEIIRTLMLIPGSIRVQGFYPNSSELLRFRQVETLEAQDREESDQTDTAETTNSRDGE